MPRELPPIHPKGRFSARFRTSARGKDAPKRQGTLRAGRAEPANTCGSSSSDAAGGQVTRGITGARRSSVATGDSRRWERRACVPSKKRGVHSGRAEYRSLLDLPEGKAARRDGEIETGEGQGLSLQGLPIDEVRTGQSASRRGQLPRGEQPSSGEGRGRVSPGRPLGSCSFSPGHVVSK